MRRRRGSFRYPILALVAFGTVIASPAAAQTPDELYDAAVRNLRRAVVPQRDGSHLSRLFALRQLKDPSVEPLLRRLVHDGDWQVQVHAILGLAETHDPPHIDPWLVTQLEHEAGEALIANALDMELVGHDQIPELLRWQELPPLSRLLLIGELIIAGETVDPADLAPLASSAQLRVAGLASLLLARLGDAAPFSAFTDRLDDVPRRERDRHVLVALEAIRQFEVRKAIPWVRRLLEDPQLSDAVRYRAILTLVALDAQDGVDEWIRALGADPSYRDRIRYGLLLLAGGDVPAPVFDRLQADDDELLQCIAETGRAFSTGANPTSPLIRMIDLGHLPSTRWALSALADLPPEQSAPVYLHLLDTVERDEPGQAERSTHAVEAATRLFDIDSNLVARRLASAKDDSLTQEVILLGLFEARSTAAGDAARAVRRIGAGRADSIALILIARHAESLSQTDLEMLGRIGAGGGRVSEGLQLQAAWLYLRHTDAIDGALAQVIDLDSR